MEDQKVKDQLLEQNGNYALNCNEWIFIVEAEKSLQGEKKNEKIKGWNL